MSHRPTVHYYSNHTVYRSINWTSPGYELSLGASLAMVGRLGAKNNCIPHTDSTSLYIDKQTVATEWLQTICFINLNICKNKVVNKNAM